MLYSFCSTHPNTNSRPQYACRLRPQSGNGCIVLRKRKEREREREIRKRIRQ